ncbi:hypothetical protein G5714_000009 [Onychostoma macrolepis]|uniref:Uncharacterized protein n=1 Tax=Onychostoma macrolepis TaxID=369639 RepID=A0A7J6DF50_9TELE|nr:hypothetical protein G5714_000009 [Onychostoma macrolepis]
MMNRTFVIIELKFQQFVAHDWEVWFTVKLIPILPSFTAEMLLKVTAGVNCTNYHVIVEGMGDVFHNMTFTRRQEITRILVERLKEFAVQFNNPDPACLAKTTSTADWLEKNFGNFSVYATLKDLQKLNENVSSFESLELLSPTQVAELTLSSGALNDTNQIHAVFDRLEDGGAFKNVEEFLTELTATSQIPDITPAVRDVMMNRTFVIIELKFQQFVAHDWEVWFTVKLIPILPSFTAEMLLKVTAGVNCTNYHVIVEGMGDVFHNMTFTRRQEITRILVERLKEFAVQFNNPDCRKDIGNDTEWLGINLGPFTTVANYTDLKELNISGFESLELLSPTQVAELTLSSGALNDTNQIHAVFDRLEDGDAFKNVEEFLELTATSQIPDITPAVRGVMMNRTFVIIELKFQQFVAHDWEVWFTVKLIPILPSFTAEMLLKVTAGVNCTNYHVIVEGMGDVFHNMTFTRRQEITRILVERLKEFAVQFNNPDCRKDIGNDTEWLGINLGPFTTVANYTDLKELNISGLAALESLSPDQKAELLLDPSTGALENVTVVKEVLNSILESSDEGQLERFFETFVEVSKEENITYIANADVRDAILNLTLTALAPKFPVFQTSDYELWFQINLVVLLASFRPSVLVVIPTDLTCDSYKAILKGLENALAVLPSGVRVELKSSIDELQKSPPEGMA